MMNDDMNQLDSMFTEAINKYEESNGKITASLLKLEKYRLPNKIAMITASELERQLLPKELDYLNKFLENWVAGSVKVRTLNAECHPMTVLPDVIKIMFMRKSETLINLFMYDNEGTPQLINRFNQDSAFGKKLAKKLNINFNQIVK